MFGKGAIKRFHSVKYKKKDSLSCGVKIVLEKLSNFADVEAGGEYVVGCDFGEYKKIYSSDPVIVEDQNAGWPHDSQVIQFHYEFEEESSTEGWKKTPVLFTLYRMNDQKNNKKQPKEETDEKFRIISKCEVDFTKFITPFKIQKETFRLEYIDKKTKKEKQEIELNVEIEVDWRKYKGRFLSREYVKSIKGELITVHGHTFLATDEAPQDNEAIQNFLKLDTKEEMCGEGNTTVTTNKHTKSPNYVTFDANSNNNSNIGGSNNEKEGSIQRGKLKKRATVNITIKLIEISNLPERYAEKSIYFVWRRGEKNTGETKLIPCLSGTSTIAINELISFSCKFPLLGAESFDNEIEKNCILLLKEEKSKSKYSFKALINLTEYLSLLSNQDRSTELTIPMTSNKDSSSPSLRVSINMAMGSSSNQSQHIKPKNNATDRENQIRIAFVISFLKLEGITANIEEGSSLFVTCHRGNKRGNNGKSSVAKLDSNRSAYWNEDALGLSLLCTMKKDSKSNHFAAKKLCFVVCLLEKKKIKVIGKVATNLADYAEHGFSRDVSLTLKNRRGHAGFLVVHIHSHWATLGTKKLIKVNEREIENAQKQDLQKIGNDSFLLGTDDEEFSECSDLSDQINTETEGSDGEFASEELDISDISLDDDNNNYLRIPNNNLGDSVEDITDGIDDQRNERIDFSKWNKSLSSTAFGTSKLELPDHRRRTTIDRIHVITPKPLPDTSIEDTSIIPDLKDHAEEKGYLVDMEDEDVNARQFRQSRRNTEGQNNMIVRESILFSPDGEVQLLRPKRNTRKHNSNNLELTTDPLTATPTNPPNPAAVSNSTPHAPTFSSYATEGKRRPKSKNHRSHNITEMFGSKSEFSENVVSPTSSTSSNSSTSSISFSANAVGFFQPTMFENRNSGQSIMINAGGGAFSPTNLTSTQINTNAEEKRTFKKIFKQVKGKVFEDSSSKKQHRSPMEDLQSQVENLTLHLLEKDKLLKSLKTEIKKLKKEKKEDEKKIYTKTKEAEKLQNEVDVLSNSLSRYDSTITRLTQSLNQSAKILVQCDQTSSFLISEIDLLRQKNCDLTDLIEKYESEKQNAEENSPPSSTAANPNTPSSSSPSPSLSSTEEIMKKRDEEWNKYVTELTSQYKQSILVHKMKIDHLERDSQALNHSFDTLQLQVESLKAENKSLERKLVVEKEDIKSRTNQKLQKYAKFEEKLRDHEFVHQQIYLRSASLSTSYSYDTSDINFSMIVEDMNPALHSLKYAKFLEAIHICCMSSQNDNKIVLYWLSYLTKLMSAFEKSDSLLFTSNIKRDGVSRPQNSELDYNYILSGNFETVPPTTWEQILKRLIFDLFSIFMKNIYSGIEKKLEVRFLFENNQDSKSLDNVEPCESVEKLTRYLSEILNESLSHYLYVTIIQQIFHQIMYFISANLINLVMQKKGYRSAKSGYRLKRSLSVLESWIIQSHSLCNLDDCVNQLDGIMDVANILTMASNNELFQSQETIAHTFPNINLLQILTLLSSFITDRFCPTPPSKFTLSYLQTQTLQHVDQLTERQLSHFLHYINDNSTINTLYVQQKCSSLIPSLLFVPSCLAIADVTHLRHLREEKSSSLATDDDDDDDTITDDHSESSMFSPQKSPTSLSPSSSSNSKKADPILMSSSSSSSLNRSKKITYKVEINAPSPRENSKSDIDKLKEIIAEYNTSSSSLLSSPNPSPPTSHSAPSINRSSSGDNDGGVGKVKANNSNSPNDNLPILEEVDYSLLNRCLNNLE